MFLVFPEKDMIYVSINFINFSISYNSTFNDGNEDYFLSNLMMNSLLKGDCLSPDIVELTVEIDLSIS